MGLYEYLHTVKAGSYMPRLTVTIEEEQSELLEELSVEGGPYDSKSEAVRNFIQAGEDRHELREEVDRLRDRLESREDRIQELEEQLAKRSQIEEEVSTLANRIEESDKPDPPWPVRWYRWVRSSE